MPIYKYHFWPDLVLVPAIRSGSTGAIQYEARFPDASPDAILAQDDFIVWNNSEQEQLSILGEEAARDLFGELDGLPTIAGVKFNYRLQPQDALQVDRADAWILQTTVVLLETRKVALASSGKRNLTKPLNVEFHILRHPIIPPLYVHLCDRFIDAHFVSGNGQRLVPHPKLQPQICGGDEPVLVR